VVGLVDRDRVSATGGGAGGHEGAGTGRQVPTAAVGPRLG
jgi:hypothetical protein